MSNSGGSNTPKGSAKSVTLLEPLEETLKTYEAPIASVKSQLSAQDATVDELVIYRFLKGWNFDETKCISMLNSKIAWRTENKMDGVRASAMHMKQMQFPYADKFCKVFPHNIYHGTDKHGQPLSIERLGLANPDLLTRTLTLDEIMSYHKHHMENKDYLASKLSREHGKVIRTCKIMDLSGLSTRHLNRQGMKIFKHLISTSQDMYPEMLGTLFVVNTPWVFNMAWKIVKPWLNENTLKKIFILGADYQKTLLEHIEKEHLPDFLGGQCTCKDSGGCVLYSDPDEGMTIVDISARGKHEERVELKQGDCVVSWEFRTRSKDIGFGVEFQPTDGTRAVVEASKRFDSDKTIVEGAYTAKEGGTLFLTWDNSFSRFTGKTVLYRLETESLSEITHTVEEDMTISPRIIDDTEEGSANAQPSS